MDTPQVKQNKTADKKAYMREYMRNRYNEKKDECRAYKNSVKCKIVNNLPAEELKEYGKYLVDIHKLRKIKEKLPTALIQKILEETPATATA
jgi:hypothetical protein